MADGNHFPTMTGHKRGRSDDSSELNLKKQRTDTGVDANENAYREIMVQSLKEFIGDEQIAAGYVQLFLKREYHQSHHASKPTNLMSLNPINTTILSGILNGLVPGSHFSDSGNSQDTCLYMTKENYNLVKAFLVASFPFLQNEHQESLAARSNNAGLVGSNSLNNMPTEPFVPPQYIGPSGLPQGLGNRTSHSGPGPQSVADWNQAQFAHLNSNLAHTAHGPIQIPKPPQGFGVRPQGFETGTSQSQVNATGLQPQFAQPNASLVPSIPPQMQRAWTQPIPRTNPQGHRPFDNLSHADIALQRRIQALYRNQQLEQQRPLGSNTMASQSQPQVATVLMPESSTTGNHAQVPKATKGDQNSAASSLPSTVNPVPVAGPSNRRGGKRVAVTGNGVPRSRIRAQNPAQVKTSQSDGVIPHHSPGTGQPSQDQNISHPRPVVVTDGPLIIPRSQTAFGNHATNTRLELPPRTLSASTSPISPIAAQAIKVSNVGRPSPLVPVEKQGSSKSRKKAATLQPEKQYTFINQGPTDMVSTQSGAQRRNEPTQEESSTPVQAHRKEEEEEEEEEGTHENDGLDVWSQPMAFGNGPYFSIPSAPLQQQQQVGSVPAPITALPVISAAGPSFPALTLPPGPTIGDTSNDLNSPQAESEVDPLESLFGDAAWGSD